MSIDFQTESTQLNAQDWFAIRVRAKAELLTATELSRLGFGVYAPVVTERRRYSDRIKTAVTAIFPGYVFCRFSLKERVSVLSAPGVQHVVSFAGVPAPIPEQDLTRVQRVIESGGRPAPYVSVGDSVRITDGPLAGVEGILLRTDGEDKLLVSIEILQRAVAVRVNLDQIELVRNSVVIKAAGGASSQVSASI